MKVTDIARLCHEANRGICEASGDHSQKPWPDAEDWQRNSAIRGVQFALANPDAAADAQHNAWMADKIAEGWVYGSTKDATAKTHPSIIPYDGLPFEQSVKDRVFRAIVFAATDIA